MNERADELAERGYGEDVQEVCSAPQKYGSFWLKVQPHVRALAEQCQKPLPRDSAPNRSLLKRVAGANRRRTVCKRSTTFVRHLLHRSKGATIARVVSRCREAEYRVWVRAMADCYPVQAYLQRVTLAKSADCPYCPGTKETLVHFACVCPQFREARTAAHNQVRKLISSLLVKCLPDRWELHEETPMANIGLRLGRVSVACMEASGRPLPEHHDGTVCVGRLQPDLVFVSQSRRKIALVELCRPMDDSSEQLAAAHERKMRTYTPLLEALQAYLDAGWQVEIFSMGGRYPRPSQQCDDQELSGVSHSAAAALGANHRGCGQGVSESLLFSTPSAMQSSQTWPTVQRAANHTERSRSAEH